MQLSNSHFGWFFSTFFFNSGDVPITVSPFPQPPFSPWCSCVHFTHRTDLACTHRLLTRRFHSRRVFHPHVLLHFWPEFSERRRQLQLLPSEPPCRVIRKSRWDDHKVKAKLELSRAGSSFLRAVWRLLCTEPCRRTSVPPEMRSSGRGKARG